MDDKSLAPISEELLDAEAGLTTAEVIRMGQVAKVLQMQIDEGLTQAEACAKIGVHPRTYRRWAAEDKVLQAIREETRGTLVSGVALAMQGYLTGIQKLVAALNDPLAPITTKLKITKELGHILRSFAVVLPPSALPRSDQPGDEAVPAAQAVAVDFKFEGPMTVKIVQRDGVPMSGTIIDHVPSE
jgi:hypothetical protein